MTDKHNTHMLLPRKLYQRVKKRAAREGTSVTQLTVEALTQLLTDRKAEDV